MIVRARRTGGATTKNGTALHEVALLETTQKYRRSQTRRLDAGGRDMGGTSALNSPAVAAARWKMSSR